MTAPPITFVTAAELRARRPPGREFVWDGYIACGAITILGAPPKVGKSTLVCALLEAIAEGAGSFAGRPCTTTDVVYVSEEDADGVSEKLTSARVHLATRDSEGTWPKPPWGDLVGQAIARAQQVDARLLVVDTWGWWAGLGPEQEKDQASVNRAIEPLYGATRLGLAVLLIAHHRKEGGDLIAALRGSNALAGAVDAVLGLGRADSVGENYRELAAVTRWTRPRVPSSMTIRRDADGTFHPLGEREDAEPETPAVEADAAALAAAVAKQPGLSQKKLRNEALHWGDRRFRPALELAMQTHGVEQRDGARGHAYYPACADAPNTHGTRSNGANGPTVCAGGAGDVVPPAANTLPAHVVPDPEHADAERAEQLAAKYPELGEVAS